MPQKKNSQKNIKKIKVTDHLGTRVITTKKSRGKSSKRSQKKIEKKPWKSAGMASYNRKKK